MERDDAYQILSDLVNKGFLVTSLDLDGQHFMFKTINEKEFHLARMLSGSTSQPTYDNRFMRNFVALSLLGIGGRLFLENRDIQAAYDVFMGIPSKVFTRILDELTDLRSQTSQAIRFMEGFSYTPGSRSMWKNLAGRLPCEEPFTGLPGTSKIGLNVVQEQWMYINRALDHEEEYSEKFSLALIVASAQNPKGAKMMWAKHDAGMEELTGQRKKLAEKGTKDEVKRAWKPDGWAAPVDTAEDLIAELNRQMEGKKDRHDLFIENYLKSLRDAAESEARAAKERIEKIREQLGGVPDIEGGSRPATAAEMEALFKGQKGQVQGTAEVHGEGYVNQEDRGKFLRKVGSKVLTGK